MAREMIKSSDKLEMFGDLDNGILIEAIQETKDIGAYGVEEDGSVPVIEPPNDCIVVSPIGINLFIYTIITKPDNLYCKVKVL